MEKDWKDDMIEMLKESLREALDRAEKAEDALRNFKAELEDYELVT